MYHRCCFSRPTGVSSSLVSDGTPTAAFSCSFLYSLSYLQASCLTDYGLRISMRMTLDHSSPSCSQMCRYSCPWTTPPCTSLSLLTWGCPCVAWRFSTNHWPLTSATSRLLIPSPNSSLNPTTTTFSTPPCPALPLPVALPVCGRSEYRL